ncbi:replication protein RepA [Alteromonas sp. V450]|uniref:replication protein RepA n=1 Tax=Alteromonas sp. V450 TaxID=1912139 RepID=UPI0008FF708C|nr:replication protein RepA [Alteromonas sp. V450]OJF69069.1 replication protein RepA [Alteromonas sp. V450]
MSLLSLKKSKPIAKSSHKTVEDFIDDALLYAQGRGASKSKSEVKPASDLHFSNNILLMEKPKKSEGMKHATFTLTPECIAMLAEIALDEDKAKSALIREWIKRHYDKR